MARTLVGLLVLALAGTAHAQDIGGQGRPLKYTGALNPIFKPPSGGGQYVPPPDVAPPGQDAPPDPSGHPPSPSPLGGGEQQPKGIGVNPVGSAGAPSRTSRSQGQGAGVNYMSAHGEWQTWWETNKFDYIELRRIEDFAYTLQGNKAETPAERELRLAATRTTIRQQILPLLRRMTESGDAAVRAAAIVSLGKLHDAESLDLAVALLSDGQLVVRRASMLALGLLSSGSSSWLLMHIADDSRPGRALLNSQGALAIDARGTALLAAALRDPSSSTLLLERLLDDRAEMDPALLALVADATGLLGSPDSCRSLIEVAFDRSLPQFVRSSATSALGRIGDPSVTPALMALLDMELEPRRAAALALGRIAHPGAEREISRLARLMLHDADAPARQFAAVSLGRIGGPLASKVLVEAFPNAPSSVRPWIALGMGLAERAQPGTKIPALLIEASGKESNADSLRAILTAIGLTRSELGLPVLVDHLREGGIEVASAAAGALGLSAQPGAVSALREVIASSNNPLVLQQACMSLGILGDVPSVPSLIELIRTTRNPYVASFAALGVAFTGDSNAAGPLISLIQQQGPSGLAATYAAAALGQLFDSDRRPALSRLASGDNYLARSSAVEDLLDLGF